MKNPFLIIFIIISSFAYSQAPQNGDSLITIIYNASYQLGNFQLTVDKRKITYEETSNIDRQGEITKRFVGKMSSSDWRDIKYFVSMINLDTLNKLVSPTRRRDHDGAGYAKLIIKTLGTIYETKDFDTGNPMKEIWSLVSVINRIIDVRLISCEYTRPQ